MLAKRKLRDLENQIVSGVLPDTRAFDDIRRTIERLARLCPAGQEGQLRKLEDELNDVLREGRDRYVQAIDEALSDPAQLLDSQEQVSIWIDVLGHLSDPVLVSEKRQQFNRVVQSERARRLLRDTKAQIEKLWAKGKEATTPNAIVRAFEDALHLSRDAVRQAIQFQASQEILTELRELKSRANNRYDDARRRHLQPVTLDQLEEFSKVITEVEALANDDPNTLVSYYPTVDSTPDEVTLIPVSDALLIARERWAGFVGDKTHQYRRKAEQRLAANDPEGAQEAINELWKLDVPDPEVLLDPDRSPVEISGDLRTELRSTLEKIEQAKAALRQFRLLLNNASNASTPDEAWGYLIEAEQSFPEFVGKASWPDVQQDVLARYREELQARLGDARNALIQGEYQDFMTVIDGVIHAVAGYRDLEEIAREADQLKQVSQDLQRTLQEIDKDLKSREPERAQQAQAKLSQLEKRMSAAGLVEPEDIVVMRTRVDAAVQSDALLARLRSDAESYDIDTLEKALTDARSAMENIPGDRAPELVAIRSFLEAKQAFVLGQFAYEQGDLERALKHLQQAAQHSQLRDKSEKLLREVQETEQADQEVRSALDTIASQPPCQAVKTLRKLRDKPTRLRRELNDALRDAEDRCCEDLVTKLVAVREQRDFDVEAVQQALDQLDSIDTQRASELKRELKPSIANREAQLAWDQEQWTQAREKWEEAARLDRTFEIRFLAALKQETLDLVRLIAQPLPGQAVNELEQKLAHELPGDPHLLFELAQARLFLASGMAWSDAEELFGKAAQVAEQARQGIGRWKVSLPKYERERQRLLADLGQPIEDLDVLLNEVQTLTKRIRLQKGIADHKARIEDYFDTDSERKRGFLHALSALRWKERMQRWLQQDPEVGNEIERWWHDLVDRTAFALEIRLEQIADRIDLVEDAGGLHHPVTEVEATHVWDALETRLIILVLDPDNPQGREACTKLPTQVSRLRERFDVEMQNTSGAGLPGPECQVVEHHIEHLVPLYNRMRILGGALDHLVARSGSDHLIQPPGLTWEDLRNRFQELARPFQEFLADLSRFKAVKDRVQQQIQAALCTGEWGYIETVLNPPPASESLIPAQLRNHRTFKCLHKELKRNIGFRERQVRRRDEVLWCLEWQEELDAKEWQKNNSRGVQYQYETRRQQEGDETKDLTEREWVERMVETHRRQARTPVEVYSLLELALDRLDDMQREDEADKCCLRPTLSWTDPITRRKRVGAEEIREALLPLLTEIDDLRRWLHPVTGGRLPPRRGNPVNVETSIQTGAPSAGRVNWKQICQDVDELRQARQFDEAIKECQRALGEEKNPTKTKTDASSHPEEGTDIEGNAREETRAKTDASRQPESHVWSLIEVQEYLSGQNPQAGTWLHSGLARMLADYAEKLREDVEKDIQEANAGIQRLHTFESNYETAWQDFSARLAVYLPLRQKSQWPLIGRIWQRSAERARWEAIKAYDRCHQICPKDPNLLAQRRILEYEHVDTDILPLWEEKESR
jgi:tetratricopeptide (TPR) repeat protein